MKDTLARTVGTDNEKVITWRVHLAYILPVHLDLVRDTQCIPVFLCPVPSTDGAYTWVRVCRTHSAFTIQPRAV